MPQPRQYLNRAAQQAAYRRRKVLAHQEQLAKRGLPRLPAVPTIPGRHRWQALLEMALCAVEAIKDERQDYYDDRSETWQDSDRGDAFKDITTEVEQIVGSLESLDLDPI